MVRQLTDFGVEDFAVVHRTREFRGALLRRVRIRKVELSMTKPKNTTQKNGPQPHNDNVQEKFSNRLIEASCKKDRGERFLSTVLSVRICRWFPLCEIENSRRLIAVVSDAAGHV